MYYLKCVDNEKTIDEALVKFKNIIGRDEIRLFFCRNGNPLMTYKLDEIMEISETEKIRVYYPNRNKYIEVTAK